MRLWEQVFCFNEWVLIPTWKKLVWSTLIGRIVPIWILILSHDLWQFDTFVHHFEAWFFRSSLACEIDILMLSIIVSRSDCVCIILVVFSSGFSCCPQGSPQGLRARRPRSPSGLFLALWLSFAFWTKLAPFHPSPIYHRTGRHYWSSFITTSRFATSFDDITTEETDLCTNDFVTFV